MGHDRVHGGELVVRALRSHGVRTVFALTGGHVHPILDALVDSDIRLVDMRHEAALVHAADAYARVSGEVGVAVVTAGPGVANAVAGLATAFEASSPVVVLAGDVSTSDVDRGALQESDEMKMVAGVTKWARRVTATERLPEYIARGFAHARRGRPGPVLLDIPADVLGRESEVGSPWVAGEVPPPHPAPQAVASALAVLGAAERPLIVAGSGARWSPGASDALGRLSDASGIPVLGKNLGRGVVAEDMERGYPYDVARIAVPEADVVALFGTRLNWMLRFGQEPRFSAQATVIQVDVVAEEIGRNRAVAVPVVADAAAAAGELAGAFEAAGQKAKSTAWLEEILRQRTDALAEVEMPSEGPLHPLDLASQIARAMPADAIVVGDGANVLNWGKAVMRVRLPGSWLEHAPFGAMGVGVPFAMGARAASEDMAARDGTVPRPVFCLSGDGAFGFFPMELHSAVRHDLPFVMAVANDGGWGADRNTQLVRYGRNHGVDFGDVSHHRLAASLGCWAARVESSGELAGQLASAVAARRPAVLDVLIDPTAGAERRANPMLEYVLER